MDSWPDGYIELLRRKDSGYCNERNLVLRAVSVDAIAQQSYCSAAGASTAVLAALGLLRGYSCRMRNSSQLRWAAR